METGVGPGCDAGPRQETRRTIDCQTACLGNLLGMVVDEVEVVGKSAKPSPGTDHVSRMNCFVQQGTAAYDVRRMVYRDGLRGGGWMSGVCVSRTKFVADGDLSVDKLPLSWGMGRGGAGWRKKG